MADLAAGDTGDLTGAAVAVLLRGARPELELNASREAMRSRYAIAPGKAVTHSLNQGRNARLYFCEGTRCSPLGSSYSSAASTDRNAATAAATYAETTAPPAAPAVRPASNCSVRRTAMRSIGTSTPSPAIVFGGDPRHLEGVPVAVDGRDRDPVARVDQLPGANLRPKLGGFTGHLLKSGAAGQHQRGQNRHTFRHHGASSFGYAPRAAPAGARNGFATARR